MGVLSRSALAAAERAEQESRAKQLELDSIARVRGSALFCLILAG